MSLSLPAELLPLWNNVSPKPKELYYRGDLQLLNVFPKVAIVGTRRPTHYTKEVVSHIASSIVERGGVVISGGAMGVDACAHRGALERTIAIVANGLDITYPAINKTLFESITEKGLILSEYADGMKAREYSFVLRNRLVVGLADYVVIAEADEKSGSLRSAYYALTYGKPLYVLPHRLGESQGTHNLIRDEQCHVISDVPTFLADIGLASTLVRPQAITKSEPLDVAYEKWKEALYMMELEGKIVITNGMVTYL